MRVVSRKRQDFHLLVNTALNVCASLFLFFRVEAYVNLALASHGIVNWFSTIRAERDLICYLSSSSLQQAPEISKLSRDFQFIQYKSDLICYNIKYQKG